MKRIACLFSSVLVLLIITTVGFAQGTTSRVTGVVLDLRLALLMERNNSELSHQCGEKSCIKRA